MENEQSSTHDRELIITRKLNAPVELVWEVWTQPEHIAKWWGPDGFTNTITTMDLVPGGVWELVMHGPDGKDYQNRSIFKEVIPLKKIVYQHFAPSFLTTIEFEAQGEETFLRWQAADVDRVEVQRYLRLGRCLRQCGRVVHRA